MGPEYFQVNTEVHEHHQLHIQSLQEYSEERCKHTDTRIEEIQGYIEKLESMLTQKDEEIAQLKEQIKKDEEKPDEEEPDGVKNEAIVAEAFEDVHDALNAASLNLTRYMLFSGDT